MKNIIICFLSLMAFSSCKNCLECECSKPNSTTVTIEKDCGYTNDKAGAERNFKSYLINEKGYDRVECTWTR